MCSLSLLYDTEIFSIIILKTVLQDIFAENLVEKKDDFLKTFSTERHYVKYIH